MQIAILDDIKTERESLRRRLTAQLDRLAVHADISEYENGGDFLAAARKNKFDLAFLDIYMEDKNGMDTAKELRLFDTDCLLVFTTSSPDYALEGFRVRALHYLVKPYSDSDLAALMDEVRERLPEPDLYLTVNTAANGAVRLRFREILYAEHFQHQIHIYTVDGRETVTRQTLRDFSASLADERFFLCSRGVIVNLEHAVDFDGTDFILENGKRLRVSRDLIKTARNAFGDFLFRKG